jgi:hypothetical protein
MRASMPPRAENRPSTTAQRGFAHFTTEANTRLTTFSVKIPKSRKAFKYIFNDLVSKHQRPGA